MRGQVVGQAFDREIGHGGSGEFNDAILSIRLSRSPGGCEQIRSQPAPERAYGRGFTDSGDKIRIRDHRVAFQRLKFKLHLEDGDRLM